MSITIGTQLGSHEITALLGKGGMGEVYRARDTKLKREVAIKILPEEFSRDPERVARFQIEAEALAALNHQNIAAIYDLQEANGTSFLVLELVEGDTLADILKKRGALPVDEAVTIARQIGDGLEAAHEKGVIHRDLKPANIKITPEGKVKLLDFGLARIFDVRPEGADSSNSPTLLSRSMPGVILGTASYMSPEQARGKTVDKRTDVWAFGVVLYEMFTGARLFQGEDVSETLASVIMKEPEWDRVPAQARRLLRSCLRKDPKQRLRDIADAKLLLEEHAPPEAISAPKSRAPWAVAGLFVVVSMVLGGFLWRAMRPGELPLRPLVRLDVDLGADVSLGSPAGPGADAIISPDGMRLAYVSQSRLFTRRLDQNKAVELPGTEGAAAPFFSPDGKWVAFFSIGGKLKKISVEGGAAIVLCDAPLPRGGTWTDGSIVLAFSNAGPVMRIPDSGGKPTPVTDLDRDRGEVTHRWPQILPGGKAVLFTAHTAVNGFDDASIEVMSFADRRKKTLQRGGTYGRYIATSSGAGYLMYVNRGTLFAVPFDLERLEVRGTPVPVLDGVAYSVIYGGSAQLDFSRTGTIARAESCLARRIEDDAHL